MESRSRCAGCICFDVVAARGWSLDEITPPCLREADAKYRENASLFSEAEKFHNLLQHTVCDGSQSRSPSAPEILLEMADADVAMDDATREEEQKPEPEPEQKQKTYHRGHDITVKTIAAPSFSYVCLELVSDAASGTSLDELTVRTYIASALVQFLGLTGSSISVDILKVEGKECWIRVPREDLSPVVAAVGGWVGGNEAEGRVGWRVQASGNWLSVLVADRGVERLWDM
jgi:ribonuclease P/MRP protein subunit POP8